MEILNQFFELFVLDIRNTMGLLFWGNFALAVLVFIFRFTISSKEDKTNLLVFGFSKIFQSFAWLAFFLRTDTVAFNPVNIIISNTLIFASFYLESIAMLMMIKDKTKKSYQIQAVIFATVLLSFYYAVWVEAASNIRIVIASFAIFALLILPSVQFLTTTHGGIFKKILGINYIVLLLALVFRIIFSVYRTTTSLYSLDSSQKILFLIVFLMMMVSGVGYLILLQEKKETQIKKLLSDKDTFFSIIAHDLRGPFNGIIGLSELLLEKDNRLDDKETNQFIQLINQSSKETYSLLENLLTWAQSQTGSINFYPQKLEVISVTNKTINLLSNIANNKNITIYSEIEENQYVTADENMLETIFRNLISNAIKFTETNGEIIVSMKKENNQTLFSIKDNGIGMDAERISNLFAINYRYTTEGTDAEKGTGIGLMLCKEFVEKHEGEIWAESEKGKGSTLNFTIPDYFNY